MFELSSLVYLMRNQLINSLMLAVHFFIYLLKKTLCARLMLPEFFLIFILKTCNAKKEKFEGQ